MRLLILCVFVVFYSGVALAGGFTWPSKWSAWEEILTSAKYDNYPYTLVTSSFSDYSHKSRILYIAGGFETMLSEKAN